MTVTPREVWLLLDEGAGSEVDFHVLWLAEALRSQRAAARIVVLGGRSDGRVRTLAQRRGLPVTVLSQAPAALLALLARERPVLLHTHGSRAGSWGRLWGWLLRIPVVSTVQDGRRRSGRRRIAAWGDALSLHMARGLIALGSPFTPLPPRARAIEHAVPVAESPATLAKTVAYVGCLESDEAPELFCRLSSMLPPMEFAVYGDGPLRGELNRRYPHVRFIAEHAGADIPWRDIGLLCITASDARAFQRALAAMAHGVPVVAFSTPSLASLIRPGEGGWLVNPGNLAAMARIIDRWETLDETARRALSDGARRLVAEHFSPNRTLSTVLAVYARAVG